MHIVQQLYQLQEVDLELDKQRRRLDELASQLGETPELAAARANLAGIHTRQASERARQKDLELETQSLETKLAAAEERMYSGRVTNPKELADLQNESHALRRWRDALDDKSLQVMTELEQSQAALNQAQAALSTIETAWTAHQQRLRQECAELKARLGKLAQARTERAQAIPAQDMARYESLRRSKGGVAIAMIEDGFCGVCGVELSDRVLTQAAQNEAWVFCGNCDRLLVE